MKGVILSIDIDGTETINQIDGPPTLDALKEAIGGGYIEVVPYFDTFPRDSKNIKCVAFCNEEGKLQDLPYNQPATALWQLSLWVKGESLVSSTGDLQDYLVGRIAVVFGDDDFMAAL